MPIIERQVGSVTVLELSGRLTMGAGSQELTEKLQDLIADGHLALLLDCSQVDRIDSQGIQALVRGFTSVEKQGGKLKLLNPSPKMREVLEITHLLPIIEAFDDEEVARRSFAE